MTYMRSIITGLLQDCKNMKQLQQIHTQIITYPQFFNTDRHFLISRLIFFCAISEHGSLSYANRVFKFVNDPNVFIYNAMIRANTSKAREPNSHLPLILYKQMLCNGVLPDSLTFPFLLKYCIFSSNKDMGRGIHGHVVKHGFENDVYIGNSLINLYCALGLLDYARKLFDRMPKKDTVSWNSMIIGSLRYGDLEMALGLFRNMEKKNIITWNSIITGFSQGGRAKEAIEFFHEMQIFGDDMVMPDKITVASVLSACASLGVIDQGKSVHRFLERSGIERDMAIGTALVDMYGKCGCTGKAFQVFNDLTKRDVLAWTAMISAFAVNGYGKEAFDLFQKMEGSGLRPNSVTFVSLLSACAHSRFVEKGKWCFDVMKNVYSIEPQVEHYACMVDILSRAGLLEEAKTLVNNMTIKPDVFVWGALLGGCLMHNNVELGEKVALYLIDLEPLNHAFYVTSNEIYLKAGRFEDVKKMRILMNKKGLKKNIPGCSTMEVDRVIYEFSVRGSNGVFIEDLMFLSNCLSEKMKIGRERLACIE